MITQGPFDLTLNTALPLNDPGANSNNPATAVQIQNASPFIVEVNAGGIVLTIQSFTAQTVPTSGGGQQMSLVPISAGPGGQRTAPASLSAVWLLAGESAPMIDGPLTAAAIASSLFANGIAGARVVGLEFNLPATGALTSAGLPDGQYRLWVWGYTTTVAGGASAPTKGNLFASLTGSGGNSAFDSLPAQEAASNRLAGAVFIVASASSEGFYVNNYMDQAVEGFITYSPA